MIKAKLFLGIQITLFVIATFIIGSFAYYFPNMPPLVRHFLVKKRISLEYLQPGKPDERFLSWFDRDPERTIPGTPNIIVSPADGFVDTISTTKGRKHVVIEMRYSDVHVQRIPIAGVIKKIEGDGNQLPKGMRIGDYTIKKMMPFQKMTTISTGIGDVVVRQITSLFAKRIIVFPKVGEAVERGQRLGRILAGSTIVIELPTSVTILVEEEQNVIGGETIIAKY